MNAYNVFTVSAGAGRMCCWYELPFWPVLIRWYQERNKRRERYRLQKHIEQFEKRARRIPKFSKMATSFKSVARIRDKALRTEAFVAYLLHLLYKNGEVVRYGWYAMYDNGHTVIDLEGVDLWCVSHKKHGGRFWLIDAKCTKDAVKNQKKKWRAGVVFPYCPGIDPIHGILPGRYSALAYEFLEELKAFFGS